MANLIWMESGSDATGDLSFYASTSGTVASATDQAYTGARSIKLSSGSPAVAAIAISPLGVLADAGRRISFRMRYDVSMGSNPFFTIRDASNNSVFQLNLTTGSNRILQIIPTGATTVSGTTPNPLDTWARYVVAYTITNTTTFRFDIYINGVFEASATAGTMTRVGSNNVRLISNAVTNLNCWFDDLSIDDGTDYADPGDIRVTNKRPNANGSLATFDTTTSTTNSGYGTGNSIYINEQPLVTTGARRHNGVNYATITIPGTAVVTSGNQQTGFTMTIPTVATNDILVLGVTNRGATADPSVVDDDSAGNAWAKVANHDADTNGAVSVWWKRATSATSAKTITVSGCTNSASGVMQFYRSASTDSDPFSGTTPVGAANASTNETQAEITTSEAGSMVFLVVGCTSNDTLNVASQAATDPSSLAEQGEGLSSGGSDCSCSLASTIKATAGATGAFTWGQTDGTGASIAFALRPLMNTIADTFTLEGASTGDMNINRHSILGRMAWAQGSGVSTDTLYNHGTPTVPSPAFSGSAALVTIVTTSSTYPSHADAIGMGRPTGSATDAILNECGMLIAYLGTFSRSLQINQAINRSNSF